MIKIFGSEGTPEWRDAERMSEMAAAWAPDAVKSGVLHIDIFCNVTKPGARYRDIDLIVSLWAEGSETFPSLLYDGQRIEIDRVVGLLELKSHGVGGVEFTRTSLMVRYDTGAVNVTEKLKSLPGPFKQFLQASGLSHEPRLGTAAWLTRFPSQCAPDGFNNSSVVFADGRFEDVLIAMIESGFTVRKRPDGVRVLSGCEVTGNPLAQLLRKQFGEILFPKKISRQRFDAVFDSWFKRQEYAKDIGKKLFLVKGAAGTGKTIVLLRMTRELIWEHGARVIFTSYNTALLSDLRGQMMRWKQVEFAEYLSDGRLSLPSVYELIGAIARVLSVDAPGGEYDATPEARNAWLRSVHSEYDKLGEDAREYFAAGWNAVYPDSFETSFIAIDEAQDVTALERDLVIKVFGHERLLVAFSDYQVSRVGAATRWERSRREEFREVRLKKVWRSFSLLTDFSKEFATGQRLDTEDERQVVHELSGGRIVIVEGSYFAAEGLHNELATDLAFHGNDPMDMLFLVPSREGSSTGSPGSAVACLKAKRSEVWNGTIPNVRRLPQSSRSEVRVLNYQSGRGLEAWTVVAIGLDVYYDWLMKIRPGFEVTSTLFAADVDIEAHRQAIRRIMMPLTRAVHTLVIEVRDPESEFAHYLRAATDSFGEQITWMRGATKSQHVPLEGAAAGRADDVERATQLASEDVPENEVARTGSGKEGAVTDSVLAPASDPDRQETTAADRCGASLSTQGAAESSIPSKPFRTAYNGSYYEFTGVRWTDMTGLIPPRAVVEHLNLTYEQSTTAADAAIDSADELTDIARSAYKAGQFARALRCVQRALEMSPRDEGRAASVVVVLRKTRRYDEAMAILRRFKGTGHERLVVQGAELLCDIGHWEHAARVLDRIPKEHASGGVLAVRGRIAAARPELIQN